MAKFNEILILKRLLLIPATAEHVRAELKGNEFFATLIGADVPESWPPGEYDRGAQEFFLNALEAAGSAGVGWYGWYAIRVGDPIIPNTVIGGAGYFGPPSAEGLVEIGYSVCPEWRGFGYATEMVQRLAEHAGEQAGVSLVVAHTSQINPASIKVLCRSGFAPAGPGVEPGVVRFEWSAKDKRERPEF